MKEKTRKDALEQGVMLVARLRMSVGLGQACPQAAAVFKIALPCADPHWLVCRGLCLPEVGQAGTTFSCVHQSTTDHAGSAGSAWLPPCTRGPSLHGLLCLRSQQACPCRRGRR